MPRRKRPDPFSEGSLLTIYNGFFRKIVEVFCPEERTHKEFMEDMFEVDHRLIQTWKVKKHFKMPGFLTVSSNVKIQGVGYRHVKVGSLLISRLDERHPDVVQIDYFGGQGNAEWLYSLNESEWGFVKLHVDLHEEQE